MSKEIKRKLLAVGFSMSMLYALFFAMPLYLNSTMLSKYFDSESVSFIYVISAIFTFVFSFSISKYVKKIHNYNFTLLILLISFLATLSLGIFDNKTIIFFAFILNFLGTSVLFTLLNLYIEEFGDRENEGSVRGIFLTLVNAGILIAPLIAGQLLMTHGYSSVYIVAALTLIPIAFLIRHYYVHIPDPVYKDINLKTTFKQIIKDKNVSSIMMSAFVLESFFTVMAIYAPLYLIQYTDITVAQYIGIILPFALIPFVLLPYELGYLADKKFGEKEMLIIGFFFVIACALLFPFFVINYGTIFMLSIFLFISRIGAAMIETMNHTYFYKKITVDRVAIISVFNNMRTLAYIITPLIATAVIYITGDIKYVFVTYAVLAFVSIFKLAKIKDTL